jgi:hypothetical protein
MAVFNGAFPVLPGKIDAGRAFAAETMGAQRAGYDESQKRNGITRETWSLQETPDGNAFVLVWFECPDVDAVFADIAQDQSEFATWFKGKVQEITGVDMSEQGDTSPEVLLDWRA